MASVSVCGLEMLALMDAGVAGEGHGCRNLNRPRWRGAAGDDGQCRSATELLTDIIGVTEDHYGDMDFKRKVNGRRLAAGFSSLT